MNELKIDDTFFKNEIDYKDLDESIYTQFAKTIAKNVDIDLAKTPLVDILTGYTRYRILQSKIDKAIEYLTSYDAISTIQGLNNIKKNKELDENTMNIMTNRYLEVHHKLLDILKENK